MARATREEMDRQAYLKEQFQLMDASINQLEAICKQPNVEQKEDRTGEIGLLVGKLQVRILNIENFLGIYDE
jgi:hypothetical protein